MVLSLRDITETHVNALLSSCTCHTSHLYLFIFGNFKAKIYFPGLVEAER